MKPVYTLLVLLLFAVQFAQAQVADTIGAGSALKFNGAAGECVDMGPAYGTLSFPFTFEAWVNPVAYSDKAAYLVQSDSLTSTVYSGFWIFIRYGVLWVEFGDNVGAGSIDRRGMLTTDSVPLNKWTEVAVVADSVTGVSVYFNGVLMPTVGDSAGTSTLTSLQYSNTSFLLGYEFNGQLDEARLWNSSRTQINIQQNMCAKLIPNKNGALVGYWKADEVDSIKTVYDATESKTNGKVDGSVARVASGAPIGNNSYSLYEPGGFASNDTAKLISALGDTLYVLNITGSPQGVQIYTVNDTPYNTSGLNSFPANYFGVFSANSSSPTTYEVIYSYSTADGFFINKTEDSATLSTRVNAAETPWLPLNKTTIDTAIYTLTDSTQTFPCEYIINVSGETDEYKNGIPYQVSPTTGANQLVVHGGQLTVYPNPSSDFIYVSLTQTQPVQISLYDILGQEVFSTPTLSNSNSNLTTAIPVTGFANGVYILKVNSGGTMQQREVVVAR